MTTALLGVSGGGATGQSVQPEGPIVIGDQDRLSGLHFDAVQIALEAFAQRVKDTTKPPKGKRLRDTDDLIRETLELRTKGWIGHANLLSFDVTGRLRLSQESVDSDTFNRRVRDLENLSDFNASAVILGQSKQPITVFGRRDQVLLNRSFGGTLNSVTTEYGAQVALQSEKAPMRLEYRHRTQSQNNPFGDTTFNLSQDTVSWQGQYRPSANQSLVWTYTLDFVDEGGTLRPAQTFDRQDAVVTHEVFWGVDKENSLRSDVRFFRDTGEFAIDRTRIDEILNLQHSPNLKSRFEYVYERQVRPEFTQVFHRATARVEHQLYDSLRTFVEAGGSYLSSTDGDFSSKALFGTLDMRYRKQVPYGRIFAIATFNTDWRDDSDRGGNVPINDDSLRFDISGITRINRRNIIGSSIVVTDPGGLITFIENVDYQVRQLGDSVELRLIPGGDISPQDSILADYVFTPDPANTTLTSSFNGTLRYTVEKGFLRGVAPFVRYLNQQQTRDSVGSAPITDSDIHDIAFGVEYNVRGLSLRLQRDIRKSSLSPFQETLLEAQYTARTGASSALSINARYDQITRPDEDFQTKLSSLSARWNGRIIDQLMGSVVLIVRNEQDSIGPNSLAFEQRLDLTWRKRQMEIFASVRNTFVNSKTDTSSQVFMIGLRREF